MENDVAICDYRVFVIMHELLMKWLIPVMQDLIIICSESQRNLTKSSLIWVLLFINIFFFSSSLIIFFFFFFKVREEDVAESLSLNKMEFKETYFERLLEDRILEEDRKVFSIESSDDSDSEESEDDEDDDEEEEEQEDEREEIIFEDEEKRSDENMDKSIDKKEKGKEVIKQERRTRRRS